MKYTPLLGWKSSLLLSNKTSPLPQLAQSNTSNFIANSCRLSLCYNSGQRRNMSILRSTPIWIPPNNSTCQQIQKRYKHTIDKKSIRITMIGPPGSGKGTQSSKIERDFGLSTISTGHLLRRLADEPSELGASVSAILKTGGLVRDDLMLSMIKEAIIREKNGWLLDGYPRNPMQAAQLDDLLHGLNQPLSLVFYLQVPEEVLLERVQERWVHPSSGRTYNSTFSPPKVPGKDDVTGEPLVRRNDDNAEALQARIRTYHDATLPLIEYYRSAGLLVPIESPTSTVGYVKIKQILEDLVS